MNYSPVYVVNWAAHAGHQWNVVSSRCRACHSALLRIVWGGDEDVSLQRMR
jgi:hypothetical protein